MCFNYMLNHSQPGLSGNPLQHEPERRLLQRLGAEDGKSCPNKTKCALFGFLPNLESPNPTTP